MIIHIVEDDHAVCDAVALFVRQMGHDVRTHSDAEGFFAAGIPGGEDIVIVDIGLPGMDGTQLVAWLNALADPPRILAITGQSQTIIRDFLEGAQTIDILRKPLSASELAVHL
ncbi:MAG: response regulator [Pseudomonadota bacterium]